MAGVTDGRPGVAVLVGGVGFVGVMVGTIGVIVLVADAGSEVSMGVGVGV